MKVAFRIVKQLFPKDQFSEKTYRIFSCISSTPNVELNKYGTFSIKGELPFLTVGEEYEYDIEIADRNQYGTTYVINDALNGFDICNLTDKQSYDIIKSVTSSNDIADAIYSAYPNFVQLIINGEDEKIDLKNIYNVGVYRYNTYKQKIINDYKILMLQSKLDKWDLSTEDIKVLLQKYKDYNEINRAFIEHPYETYCELLQRDFYDVDKFIVSDDKSHKTSLERAEFNCIDVLKRNQYDGNTRINANTMARFVERDCLPQLVEAVKNSDRIFFDDTTKYCALQSTYNMEKTVSNTIKGLVENKEGLNINVGAYKKILTGENNTKLTDEQMSVLDLVNDNRVCLLMGGAGCVDGDTEFFDGSKWKKIKEYTKGDRVLQYNLDGSATLVEPEKYWKLPCDKLYHFETKYGLSQTLCEDHDIVYKSEKGVLHHTNIKEIIKKQNDVKKGFSGKFITSFNYNGDGIDLTDDEIRLMVAVIADGSFQKRSLNSKRCRFHIKREDKKQRLRMLFSMTHCDYKEVQSANKDYTDFHVTVPRREKVFTNYWYNCNNHQLEVFCDEVMRWDGSTNYSEINNVKRQRFSTTIKESADFVQFAFSAIGKKATININDRRGRKRIINRKEYITKSIEYNVVVTERNMVGLCCDTRSNHTKTPITTICPKDGYKYCFTVPSHMLVLRNNNCIFITGNCGKSTSTKAITDMLKSESITFRLVAPTGIAARRLSKATGYKATTVHYAYYTSEGEPFVEDVIVCDEASMLSLETMYMLCSMLTQYHRLILICDPAQLASISEGNILSDIIESGIVPSVTLSKVFRFGIGKIATVTTNIRNGIPYVDNSGIELFSAKEKDYEFHIIKENPIEQIIDIFDKCINEYNYSYKDILILSPFNKGSFGTRAINSAIQEKYNPSDIYVRYKRDGKDTELHVGDKVVNCKNNREATTLEMHEENENIKQMLSDGTLPIDYQPQTFDQVFLANGDIGYVKDIDMNTKTVFVEFDLGVIVYYQDNLKNLMLAQSLSVHKCQGAEAKCIILITHPQHKRMLTRNLLYVATSRAKERLIEIGSPETINEAIKVVETEERDTYLAEMLKEIIPF